MDMTALTYTSGNTANLVGGGSASMVDISGPLQDISTTLNSGTLDSSSNLAASVFSPYTVIYSGGGTIGIPPTNAAAHYYAFKTTAAGFTKSGNTGAWLVAQAFSFDPADHVLPGRTPKLRLKFHTYWGFTAPAVTITYGLYALASSTGSADSGGYTLTTPIVTGSGVSRVSPSAQTTYDDVSSDFTLPAAGMYVAGYETNATFAANTFGSANFQLQVRWV